MALRYYDSVYIIVKHTVQTNKGSKCFRNVRDDLLQCTNRLHCFEGSKIRFAMMMFPYRCPARECTHGQKILHGLFCVTVGNHFKGFVGTDVPQRKRMEEGISCRYPGILL